MDDYKNLDDELDLDAGAPRIDLEGLLTGSERLPDACGAFVFHFAIIERSGVWGDEAAAVVLDALEDLRMTGRVEYYAGGEDARGEYLVAVALSDDRIDSEALADLVGLRVGAYLKLVRTRRCWLRSVRAERSRFFFRGAGDLEQGAVTAVAHDPRVVGETWFGEELLFRMTYES
jgi:hypothetical protein